MKCICLLFYFVVYFKSFFLTESFSNLPIGSYLREKERDRDKNGSDKGPGSGSGSGSESYYYNAECILPITIRKSSSSFDKKSGFDETKIEDLKINVIREYFYKMNILKILENKNISDLAKMELLDHYKFEYNNKNNNKNNNIFIDLMDDWDNGLI